MFKIFKHFLINCLFIFLGDIEESETEAVWSDGDLNLASSNVSF